MPSLVTPFNFNTVFDGIFVYLFSVVLYMVWSSLAFLDLVEELPQDLFLKVLLKGWMTLSKPTLQ